jgi:predicted 3-demethylubiquinone-9 3-methyltransferase (glyoxalase superfamily)
MPRITTFLTYQDHVEEAVKHYISIFPNSKILSTTHYKTDAPDGSKKKGDVMTVEFELDGQRYVALNGGEHFKLTDAVSLMIEVNTQKEIDDYTRKLIEGGGEEVACGWVRDRWGLSWQVTPKILLEMIGDKDSVKAQRVMEAMMQMKRLDIEALKRAYQGS